jgi:hypothetical protein
MANSKDYQYDRWAGVQTKVSPEDMNRAAVIEGQARADKDDGIYSPFYNKAEPMKGEDLNQYSFAWGQHLKSTLTKKQGIAARRSISGW